LVVYIIYVLLFFLDLLNYRNLCCALLWCRGTYKCEKSYLFTYECWSKQMYCNFTIKY